MGCCDSILAGFSEGYLEGREVEQRPSSRRTIYLDDCRIIRVKCHKPTHICYCGQEFSARWKLNKHVKKCHPVLLAKGRPLLMENTACIICSDSPYSAVLVPCGHASFCHECAMTCDDICPICRTPIEMCLKLYI